MSRGDPLRIANYLQHILEAIDNIRDYTVGMDLTAFMADRKTRDAVVRNLEVIGEACNNVVKNHPISPPHTPPSHGDLPMKCAMPWRMATSP